MSKKYTVNQGFMSLSTYYLEDGRHLARLHRRRRRRAYAPTSNTASHDNHEKINSWVSFSFLYGYGTPLDGPSGRWSSATNDNLCINTCQLIPGAIIGDGDRKSCDARGPWYGKIVFYQIAASWRYIFALLHPRVVGSRVDFVTLYDQKWWELRVFTAMGRNKAGKKNHGSSMALLCAEMLEQFSPMNVNFTHSETLHCQNKIKESVIVTLLIIFAVFTYFQLSS